MTTAALLRLTLTDFRSYRARPSSIAAGARSISTAPTGRARPICWRPSACSRPAAACAARRRPRWAGASPGEAPGRAWGVAAVVTDDEDETQLGTGARDARRRPRRIVRIDGETVAARPAARPPAPGLAHARSRTGCSSEARAERLRFFDRLVFAAEPAHAAARLRLREGPARAAAPADRRRRADDRLARRPGDPAGRGRGRAPPRPAPAPWPRCRPRSTPATTGPSPRPTWPDRRGGGLATAAPVAEIAAAIAEGMARIARPRRRRRPLPVRPAPLRSDRRPPRQGPPRRGMLHRRAEGAGSEPDPGPGGATFASTSPRRILYCCWTKSRPTSTRPGAPPCSTRSRRSGLQAFLTGTDESLFDGLRGRALGVRVDARPPDRTGLR